MPINRSPPLTATTKLSLTTPVLAPLQHSSSVPNIASEDREKRPECDIPNITQRNKRKCLDLDLDTQHDNQISVFMSEMKTMFLEFKEQQDKKIEKIYTSIEEIKAQNVTIQSTVTFLSQNYDALQDRINQLETQLVTERETNLLHLQKLEDNLEKMERGARSTCVEIRNIPVKPQESKESLAAMVTRIGRQWMAELKIQLPVVRYECNNVNIKDNLFDMSTRSSRYCKAFADGLGRFTGGTVSIHVREGARPVFMRARPLALALREPVERALAQIQRDGILSPVERSDCATPIVPVVKKDGNIRICAV
ncbi:unnamed protein product [Arctia plantaginis]|uniref:Uncharacterized protein n=1 Tax=Arctia plantaginis TaxID=874455 RepID=A0A8S1BLW4_ARCPL|nr:unnamed protein product [Arctia plantaginis]